MPSPEQQAREAYQARFGAPPEIVASAPGRVNLIGEHTDYNGGFVLPCAVEQRVAVALGRGTGGLYSLDYDAVVPLDSDDGTRIQRTHSWADYPRGIVWALRQQGYSVPPMRAAFAGNVPRGAGLSSSAAIESATALALDALCGYGLSRQALALLAQRAENEYVGVHSGIMDQYASLLCEPLAALLIDCRSLDAQAVPFDVTAAGLALLICDTRQPRQLAATSYNARRAECERAAQRLGVIQLRDAHAEDLGRLDGVELRRARHVIAENARVLAAVSALRARDFARFGAALYASHTALHNDFEVSTPELNVFVTAAMRQGALGARLTGAGFGGCAIALLETGALDSLKQEARRDFAENGFAAPAFYVAIPSAGAYVVA